MCVAVVLPALVVAVVAAMAMVVAVVLPATNRRWYRNPWFFQERYVPGSSALQSHRKAARENVFFSGTLGHPMGFLGAVFQNDL